MVTIDGGELALRRRSSVPHLSLAHFGNVNVIAARVYGHLRKMAACGNHRFRPNCGHVCLSPLY